MRDPRRTEFETEALVHLPALFGAAARLARDERTAEDLVQETFLRAWSSWGTFQRGTHCRAWLFKILLNGFITRYRTRGREARFCEGPDAADAFYGERARRDAADPERALLGALAREEVVRALDALPEPFRLAVVLVDLESLSYREAAEALAVPVGTVMSRLHRARRLLAARLAPTAALRRAA